MKVTGLEYASIAVNKEFKVTAVELEQEVLRRKQGGLKRLKGSTFKLSLSVTLVFHKFLIYREMHR